MTFRMIRLAFVLMLASWAGASPAQVTPDDSAALVVVGSREEQAKAAAEQAKAITLAPTADNPLPRRYAPICLKLFGIDPAFGDVIAERINQNTRNLGLPIGKAGCQPNVWIGFVSNSKEAVKSLRKQEPTMFAELKSFEIDRIFGGSGAAQVWHATEVRSYDGRPIPIVVLPGPRSIEVQVNQQYQGGRLVSPIRSDINGTIVIFDSVRANGKTVQQLADYATFRILAPVQDFAEAPQGVMPTILTLFAAGGDPPEGLTEFDWAYLFAYYKLDRGAKVTAVHDGVKQAVLDGAGQRLREKSAAE